MTINVNGKEVLISSELKAHFDIPINHGHTILNQINSGMYAKYFEGKKDLRCIDFGANVGLVSLYMIPYCKELFCVEPTPAHSKLLTKLLEDNKGECNVHYYDSALSGTNEHVYFMTGHSTENKITSVDGYGNGKIKVQGVTLSSFLFASNAEKEIIDFVKVDVEGAEIKIFTEEEIAKTKGKVKTFFIEVHPAYNGGMDENREEIKRRFIKCGYKVHEEDYQTIIAEL